MSANPYILPVAIVVVGVLVAGGLYFGGSTAQNLSTATGHTRGDFRLPNSADHVRGSANAKVAIIEFSDFECPFCSRLHPTLKRITNENPDVQWVFRHFPLSTIHSSAIGAAVASECIAKLGGNDAFWFFADSIFANQHRIGNALYEELASTAGIDLASFKSCLSDRSIASLVTEDSDEAVQAGGRGTPFVVVVTARGTLAPFSGALPYEQVKGLVDQALAN